MHIPVLLKEVIEYMNPQNGEIYVDGTFGAGGYTTALLEAADCKVYAIDRDPSVIPTAEKLAKKYPGRFTFLPGRFADIETILKNSGITKVNGIVLDIGISSMQVDQAERGFSFMREGPLDMRMGGDGPDAASFINTASEKEIADVIYNYGGEKKSRYIARAIVERRQKAPITTTTELAEIVRGAVHKGKEKIDPATRTFQAIRIWVNDELRELENTLQPAENLLDEDGRLVIVTFHSLEDSIVKDFFNEKSGKNNGVSRHVPVFETITTNATFKMLHRKAVTPSDEEIDANPRARSAKLRAARKIGNCGGTAT